jgi:hypothetical protein
MSNMTNKDDKPTVKDGDIAIRVPTRGEFFRNLKKTAQPLGPRRPKKKSPK